jgi:arginine decarboxylase
MRVDLWNELKAASAGLAAARTDGVGKRNREQVDHILVKLGGIEEYFALPGVPRMQTMLRTLERGEYTSLARQASENAQLLVSDAYRGDLDVYAEDEEEDRVVRSQHSDGLHRKHFEVLFVEDLTEVDGHDLLDRLRDLRRIDDEFEFDVVLQRSFQDALVALLVNVNIQAVVVRYAPQFSSDGVPEYVAPYVRSALDLDYSDKARWELGPLLGILIRKFRPEIDLYYITDTALTNLRTSTLQTFRRIFYGREDLQELCLTILRGIRERYETPFFSALKDYSRKPTGVFHAMPISRGNSVFRSHWMRDFGEFYGRNMFLAETSATTGGLDSLLQPTGTLKHAQEKAAVAYGARRTYFVTNGTSTANKIVVQALVEPQDLVLVDRDCHKSHHYGLVLAGAYPVYLDSYPVEEYSMYGAVPLEHIREKLLKLKAAGRLDRAKMLLLTNCTFDGLVYNVRRVMEQVLALKPDMIFLWDEAWFAFAGFTPTYKQRTAMFVAAELAQRYRSDEYRAEYEKHMAGLAPGEDPRLPDPDRVRIRVYSTQSTHKTLSSFRQGSMIHIWDQDFRRRSEATFHEAYMTHTSTSPNYQVLASLDVGRRQVQFEGYELVEKSIEMAMLVRARIQEHPQLRKYFDVLTVKDLIPNQYRPSGLDEYYEREKGWNRMEAAWEQYEFVLDPTKITVSVGRAGVDGDTFKNRYLMDRFNIQINKTSRNTVLFMTNIGTTRGSVAYLVNALLRIADELDDSHRSLSRRETELVKARIHSLTNDVPPLPDFSRFHESFQAVPNVPGGDLREAYFLACGENNVEYAMLHECAAMLAEGREPVSASFVIPYPPGFPVLVPGQVVSSAIVAFLQALDVKEIHGYRADLGLKIFTRATLDREKTTTALGMSRPAAFPATTNPRK